ncbi:hypothetical protein MD484_g7924, partial [Candolleomyces efflorescens]
MSEDDRAAKAARAKALLAKKRGQKKKAGDAPGAITPAASESPVIPPRTFSPAPSEASFTTPANGDDKRDLADVFSAEDKDPSWISSLTRAPSPPARVTSESPQAPSKPPTPGPPSGNHVGRVTSPGLAKEALLQEKLNQLESVNLAMQAEAKHLQELLEASRNTESLLFEEKSRADNLQKKLSELQEEKESQLATERQTISLLVTEKAALTAELEKREDVESRLQTAEEHLHSETSRSEDLERRLRASQSEIDTATEKLYRYQSKEKELADKSRDLERQLQLSTVAATESRKEAEDANRRLQELTEQIQTDDRVERSEQSLKHSQDRADELEFQLSKLRQTHASLKSEKDELAARCQKLEADGDANKVNLASLEAQLKDVQAKYSQVAKERENLAQEASTLREQSETAGKTTSELQEKLVQASSAVATHTRQMQVLQNELKSAVRRAEESEKTTRNLQLEGTNLMRSLDEMRPKVVELTNTKLDLAEKVEHLERSLAERDRSIGKLEASLDELQDQSGASDAKWKDSLSQKDKTNAALQVSLSELQKGYDQLQEELDTALASLKTLEAQRTAHHQDTARRLEEIDRLTSSAQSQEEELSSLQHELETRRKVQEEEHGFLERAQNEIESLRSELDAKDEEIDELREAASSPKTTDAPRSLDDEMLSSIRQQHALDLSNAQSTIRALENSVFDGEAKIHGLQKQIASLQDQVTRLQAAARQPPRSFSPTLSRPASRTKDHDLRRAIHKPANTVPPPLSRTVFDQALSPETLHKRKGKRTRSTVTTTTTTSIHVKPPRHINIITSHLLLLQSIGLNF